MSTKHPTPKDYHHELKLHRSSIIRWLLIACGAISFGLGVLGIFLPVLPTTPFLLLSAACFARSSARFYNWLTNNRFFGKYIRTWREHHSVPKHAKIIAIVLMLLMLGSSVLLFIPLLPIKLLVGAVGVGVLIFLLRLPRRG